MELYSEECASESEWRNIIDNSCPDLIIFGKLMVDLTVKLSREESFKKFGLNCGEQCVIDSDRLEKITLELGKNHKIERMSGGTALNTSRALKVIGKTNFLLIGCIGNDSYGHFVRKSLVNDQINACVQIDKELPTGQCLCLTYETERSLYPNAIGKYVTKEFVIESQRKLRFFHNEKYQTIYMQGYFVVRRYDLCAYVIETYGYRSDKLITLNLSAPYLMGKNSQGFKNIVSACGILFGNMAEFKALAEIYEAKNVRELAEMLVNNNVRKILIITNGHEDIEVYQSNGVGAEDVLLERFPVMQIPRENIVDTVGAGDAFVAGFLSAHIEGLPVNESIQRASEIAGKVVMQIGCHFS